MAVEKEEGVAAVVVGVMKSRIEKNLRFSRCTKSKATVLVRQDQILINR